MRIESPRWPRTTVYRTLVAAACCLVLPEAGRAQTAEQQKALASRFDRALHDWFDDFLDRWLGRQSALAMAAN